MTDAEIARAREHIREPNPPAPAELERLVDLVEIWWREPGNPFQWSDHFIYDPEVRRGSPIIWGYALPAVVE